MLDHHGADARIKKAFESFGALNYRVISTRDVSERLQAPREDFTLVVSWCSRGAAVWLRIVTPHGRVYHSLRNWLNKRIDTNLKRTGVFSVRCYLAT